MRKEIMVRNKRTRMLASWDGQQQERYRRTQGAITLHFVLDASPSMDRRAGDLRRAFNLYLNWLKRHCDPMAMAEVRCFSDYLDPSHIVPLGTVTPLTPQSYDPLQGDGTALYQAIGETCTTTVTGREGGQHILVVFTDGLDNRSDASGWTCTKVQEVLQVFAKQEQWLAVFLGAMPEALEVGQALGFAKGNCLLMSTDQIPEAFKKMTEA